jgi:hypothetical protein
MKTAVVLLIVGIALLISSLTLSPYKDEKLFNSKYMEMSSGQSDAFFKLRDEMLTPKFQLEDYGISLLALAGVVFFLYRKEGLQITAPSSRKWLVVLAMALPFITVAGYVYDLLNAYNRGEFPHWADSMGIPLMSAPVLLIGLLFWVVGHFGFLHGDYPPMAKIERESFYKTNIWLKFVSAVAVLLTLLFFALGQYWYAIPSLVWVYFYLSLAAVRLVKTVQHPSDTSKNPSANS